LNWDTPKKRWSGADNVFQAVTCCSRCYCC